MYRKENGTGSGTLLRKEDDDQCPTAPPDTNARHGCWKGQGKLVGQK